MKEEWAAAHNPFAFIDMNFIHIQFKSIREWWLRQLRAFITHSALAHIHLHFAPFNFIS